MPIVDANIDLRLVGQARFAVAPGKEFVRQPLKGQVRSEEKHHQRWAVEPFGLTSELAVDRRGSCDTWDSACAVRRARRYTPCRLEFEQEGKMLISR